MKAQIIITVLLGFVAFFIQRIRRNKVMTGTIVPSRINIIAVIFEYVMTIAYVGFLVWSFILMPWYVPLIMIVGGSILTAIMPGFFEHNAMLPIYLIASPILIAMAFYIFL